MNLQEEFVTAIHDLFVLRYMTISTPASSKKSRTVLLYKREDPLDSKSHRPIALANTLNKYTKLYTGLLTDCMTDYAEHHDKVYETLLASAQTPGEQKGLQDSSS